MINILVCIKAVVLDAPDGRVVRLPETCELNPFDRPALETALGLKEERGGEVTALSMGPEAGVIALYEAMSMGVDRAVLISDPSLAGSDTLVTSSVLAAAISRLGSFDLIIFGARTSDSDTGQVGPQTAVLLDLPLITGAHTIEFGDSGLMVERRVDEFIEKYEVSTPCVLTMHPAAVQARDSALTGIEGAFGQRPIERMDLDDLKISPDLVGEKGSPTRLISMSRIRRKRKCDFITGTVEEQADELLKRLRESGLIG